MMTALRTVDLVAPRVLFTLGIDLRTLSGATAGEKLGGENNLLEILQRTATALDDLRQSLKLISNRQVHVLPSGFQPPPHFML